MRGKKIIATLMALITLCTSETIYASDNEFIYTIPEDTLKFIEEGHPQTIHTELYADIDTSYSVVLPKQIKIDPVTKSAEYTVKVSGDIGGVDAIFVNPDPSFELTTSGKPAVTAVITQEQNQFMSNEIEGTGAQTNGKINADKLSAGTWNGKFNFSVSVNSYKALTLTKSNISEYTDLSGNPIETSGDVVIPEFVKDGDGIQYVVNELASSMFYNNKDITSADIPGSVREIPFWLFRDCSNLVSVHFSQGTKIICMNAFYGCEQLSSIELPDGITKIGSAAFSGCKKITHIDIPDSVTEIKDSAFQNCSSLISVKVPDSVTEIGDRAFDGCTNLTSIDIPDSVTEIGEGVFSRCDTITSVIIPDDVNTIGLQAFSSCTNLKSVTLPNSLKKMGKYVFVSCSKLSSVTYKGITYTSKSSLINALTKNGVSLIDESSGNNGQFDGTALLN